MARAVAVARATDASCTRDRLRDLGADALHRVERGHRVLEHHGDVVPADLAVLVSADAAQRPAGEPDVARR